jgi:hypothetical protein
VVDADQGPVPAGGQAFGEPNPDQQTPDQARAPGHGQQLDVPLLDACPPEGGIDEAGQAFEVISGGELGDDAAVRGVEGLLGVDDVGEDCPPAGEPDRGLVTARLDAQDERVLDANR